MTGKPASTAAEIARLPDPATTEFGAVYLAGRYSRRAELAVYADELRAAGWVVTSNWLNETGRVLPDGSTLSEHQEWLVERPFDSGDGLRIGGLCAQQDVDDVLAADTLVMFTEGGRGGRHVEFGLALGRDLRVIVVGARENVFHTLPQVEVYPFWPEARTALIGSTRQNHPYVPAGV